MSIQAYSHKIQALLSLGLGGVVRKLLSIMIFTSFTDMWSPLGLKPARKTERVHNVKGRNISGLKKLKV